MTFTEPAPPLAEPKPDYDITIRHCNSIDEAQIALRRGALNIKYGPNGIGKSTIARALTLRAADGDQLSEKLTPFKYRDKEGPRPSVHGADDIMNVMTFNDDYVSKFVFRPNEVLENSFEIFINTEEYRAGIAEIDEVFESLRSTFSEGVELNEAILHFTGSSDIRWG